MSVGKRVFEAITKMQAGDAEGAFFQICAALEDTARREYQARGKQAFKCFVADNLNLITRIGIMSGGIGRLRLGYVHPEIKVDSEGLCGIEDVVYHAIRCGLYHEGKLPANLRFAPESTISVGTDGSLILPKGLVDGVVLAVVLSPANAGEVLPEERVLNIGRVSLPFAKAWGRRQEVTWLLDAMTDLAAAAERASAVMGTASPSPRMDGL